MNHQTQWDKLANSYGMNIIAQRDILWPHITHLLEREIKNKNVLDIGCGNGMYAKFFYTQGAHDVTGIDNSSMQIEIAKTVNAGPTYIHVRAEEYISSDTRFDIILMNMLVCNIQKDDEIWTILDNAYKMSSSDAKLYISNVAPDWQKNCTTKILTHTYPSIYTQIIDGTPFYVTLSTINGEIGPFMNYHWSIESLEKITTDTKWRKTRDYILSSIHPEEGLDSPKYILSEFVKVK